MKMKFVMTMVVTLLMIVSVGKAAKVDMYRDALINKSFTLKYEIITPPIRQVNKEATIQKRFFKEAEVVDKNSVNNLKHGGIIVVDGENKYNETSYSNGGVCELNKDGESFVYYWKMKNNQKEYYGSRNAFGGGSRSIKAQKENDTLSYSSLMNEYDYDSELTQAFAVILPPDEIVASPYNPQYKFLGSGTLNNGLSYEDFVSIQNNTYYAARYYFDGNNLVKIAMADYTDVQGSVSNYEKIVISIKEFSTTPDETYLSLPSTLKDKTKRK